MSVLRSEIRRGAYHDSIVLMQLQSGLSELPGVLAAGAVMGSADNLALLAQESLEIEPGGVGPSDLVVAVRAVDGEAAAAALAQIDPLLRRPSRSSAGAFRPRSLATALRATPEAPWVVVSVPGVYAARVARQALDAGRHVFLFSDNVSPEEERGLKLLARDRGLLVLGPDCGSAIVGGVGLGFANQVRRGNVGLVAASGTGLQAMSCELDERGAGVSHAIGTGGRDLSVNAEATTTLQGLELLERDPATAVVVLLAKPPARSVARGVLARARTLFKLIVVYWIGWSPPARQIGRLHFASSLSDAARLAVELSFSVPSDPSGPEAGAAGGYLRGLFAGGTLALEAAQGLVAFLSPLHSNVGLGSEGLEPLPDPTLSQGHCIVDLGADELTLGRPHPMIDSGTRLERLAREGRDPGVSVVILDLVLGFGSHSNPAAELGPVIRELVDEGHCQVAVVVVGSAEDPQHREGQEEALRLAGARVFRRLEPALDFVLDYVVLPVDRAGGRPVSLDVLRRPAAVINVGLGLMGESLESQGVDCVQVDWRPPAGGDPRLMRILDRVG